MKISNAVVSGLCAWGLSLPALAQAPATTITIGDLPALGGGRVNNLATITITENHPAAISSGTFTLYFPDNPDQTVEFQSGTSVIGPATTVLATNYLIINVETDDTQIDTFVIQPEAYYRTRLPIAPGFALMDGDPNRANRTGLLDGVTLDRFELGTMGDIIGLEIGFEENVAVGETIVLDIRTAEGENTGPYTAETLAPAIATAVVDGTTVRVTGVSPGTTHAVVEDSLGRHDMVLVHVLPGSGGLTGGPSTTLEPETSAPEVAATPDEADAPDESGAPDDADVPDVPEVAEGPGLPEGAGVPEVAEVPVISVVTETPEPPEVTEDPTPAPELAAAPGTGGGSGTDSDAVPEAEAGPDENAMPATADEETDTLAGGEPVLAAGNDAAPLDSNSPALELPSLGEATVVGGGSSTAVITAGATANGTSFHDSFDAGDRVNILGHILPEVAQINAPGELFVAVKITTPMGGQAWFHKNGETWERWDGRLVALQPAREATLAGTEDVEIFDGELQPGRYEIYLGYAAQGDALIYSGEPLVVEAR